MTGAPEAQPGEAVEQEAHNFVSGFGAVAINSAAGKPHNDFDDSVKDVPDPTSAAINAVDMKGSVEGRDSVAQKATKKPMEDVIWETARPFMQYVGAVADTWERFAKYVHFFPSLSDMQSWLSDPKCSIPDSTISPEGEI